MPPTSPDRWRMLVPVAGVAVMCLLLHIALAGTVRLSILEIAGQIVHGMDADPDSANAIVWQIRLPRALGTLGVGAALSLVGAAYQWLFRNPLAEPYTVGAAGGATVGGTLAVALGLTGLMNLGIVAGSVVGALIAVAVVVSLAKTRPDLLLAGVVVSTLTASLTTVLLLATGHDTNQVMRWLLGSTSALLWVQVGVVWLGALVAFVAFMSLGRALNVLAASDTAETLGVDSVKASRSVLAVGAIATAAAVGTVGIIGFIGMVSALLARRIAGTDARVVLPYSALLGGSLLLLADLLAQTIVPGRELPVGAVTALLGAPVFLATVKSGTATLGSTGKRH